jgi:hypothetical protein
MAGLGALRRPLAGIFARRYPGISGKGHAERAGRAIAEALGDIRYADARLAQPLHGQGHAPAQQIAHRGHSGQAGKAFK